MANDNPQRFNRTNPPTTQRRIFYPPVHSLPNEIVTPSIVNIYSRKKKLGYYEKPLPVEYGENLKIELSGAELCVRDEIVLIALIGKAREHQNLIVRTSKNELRRQLYKSCNKESRENIGKSIDRLQHAKIKIIVKDKEGEKRSLTIGIIFALGERKKIDQIAIQFHPYFERLLGYEMMTSLDLPFLLSLKGDITKQCYLLFQRHVSARAKEDEHRYGPVGLIKFCDWIGLDREHKLPLFKKRDEIRKAFAQLKRRGYLIWWNLENDLVEAKIKFQKVPTLPEIEVIESRKPVRENRVLAWEDNHDDEEEKKKTQEPKRQRGSRQDDLLMKQLEDHLRQGMNLFDDGDSGL